MGYFPCSGFGFLFIIFGIKHAGLFPVSTSDDTSRGMLAAAFASRFRYFLLLSTHLMHGQKLQFMHRLQCSSSYCTAPVLPPHRRLYTVARCSHMPASSSPKSALWLKKAGLIAQCMLLLGAEDSPRCTPPYTRSAAYHINMGFF